MIKRIVLADGRYLILTTRRAAHVSHIFGKASIYKSKESYDKNDVLRDGYTVITSIHLGNTQAGLPAAIDEFIKRIESTKES